MENPFCFKKMLECKIFKQTLKENKESVSKLFDLLSADDFTCLDKKIKALLWLFRKNNKNSTFSMTSGRELNETNWAFYSAFRLFLMGYYKQGRATLRTALESTFRILYLRLNPEKAREYVSSDSDKWVILESGKKGNLKKHYKKMPNSAQIEKKVRELAKELSSHVHAVPLNKVWCFDDCYLFYDKKRFLCCLALLEKTYWLCVEMAQFEINFERARNPKFKEALERAENNQKKGG